MQRTSERGAAAHTVSESLQNDKLYLESVNVESLLEELVLDIIRIKPLNVLAFIEGWASQRNASHSAPPSEETTVPCRSHPVAAEATPDARPKPVGTPVVSRQEADVQPPGSGRGFYAAPSTTFDRPPTSATSRRSSLKKQEEAVLAVSVARLRWKRELVEKARQELLVARAANNSAAIAKAEQQVRAAEEDERRVCREEEVVSMDVESIKRHTVSEEEATQKIQSMLRLRMAKAEVEKRSHQADLNRQEEAELRHIQCHSALSRTGNTTSAPRAPHPPAASARKLNADPPPTRNRIVVDRGAKHDCDEQNNNISVESAAATIQRAYRAHAARTDAGCEGRDAEHPREMAPPAERESMSNFPRRAAEGLTVDPEPPQPSGAKEPRSNTPCTSGTDFPSNHAAACVIQTRFRQFRARKEKAQRLSKAEQRRRESELRENSAVSTATGDGRLSATPSTGSNEATSDNRETCGGTITDVEDTPVSHQEDGCPTSFKEAHADDHVLPHLRNTEIELLRVAPARTFDGDVTTEAKQAGDGSCDSPQTAAVVIQSKQRQIVAKGVRAARRAILDDYLLRLEDCPSPDRAAIRIQSQYRMHRARSEVSDRRQRLDSLLKTPESTLTPDEAAVVIQSKQRQIMARRLMLEKQEEVSSYLNRLTSPPSPRQAALRIQQKYRQFRARKIVAARRREAESYEEEFEESDYDDGEM